VVWLAFFKDIRPANQKQMVGLLTFAISRTNIFAMNTFSEIRKRLQQTQSALAESLGVTQSNVAHYEAGQTVPPDVARRLIDRAAELGHDITFNDVYGLEKSKVKPRRKTKVSHS
jgi:DNA-binding transcriptional regulator YiaG